MNDLISRAAAIDAIDAVFPVDPMKSEYAQGIACGAALAKTYVEQLPSAQPEQRRIPFKTRPLTKAEAIAQLKMDRDLCNFNPMTGEEEPMNEDCIKRDEAYSNMVHAICDSDMLGSQKERVLSAMPNPKKMRNSTCDAIMHICKSDMLGSQKEQVILNRMIKDELSDQKG